MVETRIAEPCKMSRRVVEIRVCRRIREAGGSILKGVQRGLRAPLLTKLQIIPLFVMTRQCHLKRNVIIGVQAKRKHTQKNLFLVINL